MPDFKTKLRTFLPIRKLRHPGGEDAKYKQIDRTHVDSIAEWQVILL